MTDLQLIAANLMAPKIITYFLCGMRHPTTGLSEDDLSRLTGSSSSTASCGSNNSSSSSSSSPSSASNTHSNKHHTNGGTSSPERRKHTSKSNNSPQSPTRFTSTYLPEFINPLEWQKSRKRKERLDSTSTATQERKLQRSNSEELLPPELPTNSCSNDTLANGNSNVNGNSNATSQSMAVVKAADVIRRVCSEDFQKSSSYAAYAQEFNDTLENSDNAEKKRKALSDENNSALANRQQSSQQSHHHETPTQRANVWAIGQPTKDMSRRVRTETSPARSQRFSPVRSSNGSSKLRDSDDSECEHERRRSSERFCKTRAPPGRKAAGVSKKTSSGGKYLSSRRNDEGAYKYDLSALKYERRGFVSKKFGASNVTSASLADHNDNNLIDFNTQQSQENKTGNSAAKLTSSNSTSDEDNNTTTTKRNVKKQDYITAQEALPWEHISSDDQAPVLSRRYGAVRNHPVDNMETAAKLAKAMPYPQPQRQTHVTQLLMDDDTDDGLDTMEAYRAFTSLENIRTRDLMQQVIPAMMSFQSPEERLKQVNKRLTALKKKLIQLEEAYEARMGYRPSQAERINDKYMKNVLAELSKLRKERHELKADPMGALGLKMSSIGSAGLEAAQKLDKMKTTLEEIEESLSDKRHDAKRPEILEELTAEQQLQEKTAVQHGLLYFEQLYGRPTTKNERDAARPLYTRYRLLKRMVSRSVVVSGVPELPTILEHEPFESFPQQSSNNSTETTNTPSDSVAPNLPSSDDSTTTTTTGAAPTTTSTNTATSTHETTNENISDLSIEQLWEQLDKTREEKKLLKRTIREYETIFEEQNGRKMLKNDRRTIEDTYIQYKEKKAKTRLLQALIKKQIQR